MSLLSVRWLLLLPILALPGPALTGDAADHFGVRLSRQRQQLAGIRTRTLPAPRPLPSRPAWAYTLDPAPLLEAATEHHQLHQSWRNALETAQLLEQRYQRLQHLGTSIKRREREQARIAWLEAQNRLQTLVIRLEGVRQRIVSRWGAALGEWVFQRSARLRALADGTITLVRVVPDAPGPARLVYRQRHIPLNYLSPLPGADPRLGSPAALFWAGAAIPHGLRLQALTGETAEAVPVPATAVVWYAGQPWIYLQTDAETFRRHPLGNRQVTGDTWWVREDLGGRRIVVQGVQLLLAEEFRTLVPEEDDD